MKFAINLLLAYIMLATHLCYSEVVLRFQTKIDSTAQYLGDLLTIENDVNHWAKLPLQSRPSPGQWISKNMMISWMNQKIGSFEWKWQGKTKIQVKQTIKSSSKDLQNKAKTALIAHLGTQYKSIKITSLSQPKDSEYALEDLQINIKNTYPTAKRVCVWLNHEKKHIPIWFKVKAYDRVLVAHNNLSPNSQIKDSDFSFKERNIAGLKNPPVKLLANNAWLKSHVGQGTILQANQVTQAPLVTHGQSVRVSIHQNSINIVMEGIALSDGRLGQTISIKNPSNQQTFVAQITGSQQAEVRS